jgi:hypothetical protein
MKPAKRREPSTSPVQAELEAIKRLMIFSLLRSGATQRQVAQALNVDQSQVSRMFPAGLSEAGKKRT